MVRFCIEKLQFLIHSGTQGEYLALFLVKYSGSCHLTAQKFLKHQQDVKLPIYRSLPANVLLLLIGLSLSFFALEVHSHKTKTLQNGTAVITHFLTEIVLRILISKIFSLALASVAQ